MTNAELYIKAARRVHSGKQRFSCNAVLEVGGDRSLYSSTMANTFAYLEILDIEPPGKFFLTRGEKREAKGLRVWLLCMMAACCEDMKENDFGTL